MKPLLLSFCVLVASKGAAQRKSVAQEAFPYATQLQEIHRKDSLARFGKAIWAITRQVAEQQLPAAYFAQGHYKLLGYHTAGWHEIYPGPKHYFDQKFSALVSLETFTTQDILAKFNRTINDSVALTTAPILTEQNLSHKRWTPVAFNRHYFIFRRIHSYPHGNQTSWYTEMTYYFERVD